MTRTDVLDRRSIDYLNAFLPESVPAAATTVTLVTMALWTVLLGGLLPHPPIPGAMTAPGAFEAMGTSNGLWGVAAYLVGWGVMMSAMMYPSMIPVARRYVDALDEEPPRTAAAYVATVFGAYSLVWTAAGLVPLLVDASVGVRGITAAYGTLLLGAFGIFVAAYQQSDRKLDALDDCCRGVSVDDPSLRAAASKGLEHGFDCVTATWPFFAVMVLAGSMNPVVMLGLTIVVAAERLPACSREFVDAIGVTAGVAGVCTLLVAVVV